MLEDLERTQWLTRDEHVECQERRLRNLIEHAWRTSPFYRRLFRREGILPDEIQTIQDLPRVPFLTKSLINANLADLVSRGFPKRSMVLHHTSGTAGTQMRGFYLPKRLLWRVNAATLYRFYRWAGVNPRMRRATIAGRHFTDRPPYIVRNRAGNQLLLSAHHLSRATIDSYLSAIEKFRPQAIQGHPTAISTLARRLQEVDNCIQVGAVLTTGEQLFSDQRDAIEERFQCRVFDAWGHGESAGMAAECEYHNGYHIAMEYGIIEVIKDRAQDEWGEIVVTSLHNYAMPFIRYRTGDLAVIEDAACACGRDLPRLKRILGRIDDVLCLPNGTRILPVTIRTLLRGIGFTSEYQLRQTDRDRICFYIREGERTARKSRNALHVLSRVLTGMKVDLVYTDEITVSGAKQRLVVGWRGPSRGGS